MTRRVQALIVVAMLQVGGVLIGTTLAQGPALPDCDRIRAENLKLRAQVLDLQRNLAQMQLDVESQKLQIDRQELETSFRELLKPAATDVFDWQTLTFKPPPKPEGKP